MRISEGTSARVNRETMTIEGGTWDAEMGMITGADARVSTKKYDAAGNVLEQVDTTGAKTETTYDELNRAKTYTNVFGQVLTYGYDAEDRSTRREDSLGGVQTSTYKAVGLLTSRRDPITVNEAATGPGPSKPTLFVENSPYGPDRYQAFVPQSMTSVGY